MQLKHVSLALAIGLGLGSAWVLGGQAATASANKGYKDYNSFPKPMRGTWQEKSHKEYYKGKYNANWTYKFNKNSYSMIVRVKGKKVKTIHFPKKDINEIAYIYRLKQYHIQPKVTKKNYTYAGIIDLKPVMHHGKKTLAVASPLDGSYTYYYKVKK
ncbi:hypothetical protein [Levilactobacillus zymae]|uniref:hypothetical protein n=1 Tax=Levilactobacillus zymae TaxID=267363 RepID=UPI0028B29B88|nr:hypothetical protein [Levilactobacillus zymae]MDT6980568.1 hypothetical protein [Levilactobacillus zymae]